MTLNSIKNKLTVFDIAGVYTWRHLLMPLIAAIGGKKYPKGRVKEFAYGSLKNETLDFIQPNTANSKKIAVVHIHGGAWIAGSKGNFYTKPLMRFSDAGYPVFSLNYPLAPEQQHPFLLRSLIKALVWIEKNHPEYEKIHLIGDSAGGNLAMMLGIYISNPELLKILDPINVINLPVIKSIVDIFGVNDRTSWIEDGFPSAKLFNKLYVANTSTPQIPLFPMDFKQIENLPSIFIVGAGEDKLLRSSKIWAEHISKKFDQVQFKIYKGAAHGFFSFGKGSDELSHDMLHFFNQNN